MRHCVDSNRRHEAVPCPVPHLHAQRRSILQGRMNEGPAPGTRQASHQQGETGQAAPPPLRHGAPEQTDRYYVGQPRLESQPRVRSEFGEEPEMDRPPHPVRRSRARWSWFAEAAAFLPSDLSATCGVERASGRADPGLWHSYCNTTDRRYQDNPVALLQYILGLHNEVRRSMIKSPAQTYLRTGPARSTGFQLFWGHDDHANYCGTISE